MYVKRLVLVAAMLAFSPCAVAQAARNTQGVPPKFAPGHQLFMKSARESVNLDQVRLPLYRGVAGNGSPAWFVVTDASSPQVAELLGVNFSPKLGNTIGTGAVMHATWPALVRTMSDVDTLGLPGIAARALLNRPGGLPTLPFTPKFGLARSITPGPPGVPCPPGQLGTRPRDNIPVSCFTLGADGSNGQGLGSATGSNSYSPLIQIETLGGPIVLNAAQVANNTGHATKVIRLEGTAAPVGQVVYVETAGVYEGRTIHYASFDSSIQILSTLENITWAPALNRSPSTPTNSTIAGTARSGIIAITNGPEGLGNPERRSRRAGSSRSRRAPDGPGRDVRPGCCPALECPGWQ
jgi:hypothetical protein